MKSVIALFIVLASFQPAFATTTEEVKQKTSDAAASAMNYSKEQKDAFQKEMEANLAEMKNEINALKKAAAEKSGDAKKEMNGQINNLEKKQATMSKDLAQLKKSSGKAWGHMKDGMSKAWDSISDSYSKAKAEYAEQK
ncbi:hypothetical protein [Bdellovibrio sp. HCB274]|uniref:hypothetical protein n=1 Tax=Bdellovibrio sp. HCB274 TaxID=3394361 RepID=UPI0039B420C9